MSIDTKSSSVKRHMLSHANEKPFQCGLCSVCFSDKSSVKLHVVTHHQKRSECPVTSNVSARSKRHSKTASSSGFKFKCKVCLKLFLRISDFMSHVMSKHANRKDFRCEICGNLVSSSYGLKSHKLRHINLLLETFKCGMCGKCVASKSELKSHVRIHSGEKPYRCDVCGKCCSHHRTLKYHMMSAHVAQNPLQCGVCFEEFEQYFHLELHMLTHTSKNIST